VGAEPHSPSYLYMAAKRECVSLRMDFADTATRTFPRRTRRTMRLGRAQTDVGKLHERDRIKQSQHPGRTGPTSEQNDDHNRNEEPAEKARANLEFQFSSVLALLEPEAWIGIEHTPTVEPEILDVD
jgi:hypothetical protein